VRRGARGPGGVATSRRGRSSSSSRCCFLWSTRDDLKDLYGDPTAIWRDWATDVQGHGIDSGHHMAEHAPLAGALTVFVHADAASR
jgi:hypothetical protein